ncbi:MAG: 6-phosphogluconolactonase [Roseobacter sp.]
MEFIEYPDREIAVMSLADTLAGALRRLLAGGDRVSFAVPGGTTPAPVFDALCAADLDWSRVTVMLTDERWVPTTSERSNTALIKQHLLQGHAAAASFAPFYKEGLTAQKAAETLSEAYKAHFPLSLVLLGMGSDMHTASLFPGAPGVDAALSRNASALCAVTPPDQPEPRITLSARVLNSALEKHVVIFGQDKRDALENARGRTPVNAPINAVLQGGTVHWAA